MQANTVSNCQAGKFLARLKTVVPAMTICLGLSACSLFSSEESVREVEVPVKTNDMAIDVGLSDIHRCSRISPQITVTDPPAGTTSYAVRLVEFTRDGERYLGGGTWQADGSGIIPEGGLTLHYRGPCPQRGRTGSFAYVVSAMGQDKIQPLAVRLYKFDQE